MPVTGKGENEFTAADFLARARRRLTLDLPPIEASETGDHVLDGLPIDPSRRQTSRPAAVLVPIVPREVGVTILLTKRAGDLREHSGQIAFPGGKIDPADPTPIAAALREAREEIGLDPGRISPLGYLDPYLTGTEFRVLPIVALIETPFALALNPAEVDEAFEVPLSFLMQPGNHLRHSRDWKGRVRNYYAMPWQERYIWGATAGIIRNLYERLYHQCGAV